MIKWCIEYICTPPDDTTPDDGGEAPQEEVKLTPAQIRAQIKKLEANKKKFMKNKKKAKKGPNKVHWTVQTNKVRQYSMPQYQQGYYKLIV